MNQARSIDGIPSINVVFPDGYKDTLVLERHYMTETDRLARKIHCNFIGHLAKDSDACVAVTGCPGKTMEFSINSKHAGKSSRFILHESGDIEIVESAFKVNHYFTLCRSYLIFIST